jgi:predicted ATPase
MDAPFATPLVCPLLLAREPQLAALDTLVAQACAGHGRTVLVTGEAGVGKSRLVAEVQAQAEQHGVGLIQGRCFEPDRVLPYAPLLDLLAITSYMGGDMIGGTAYYEQAVGLFGE